MSVTSKWFNASTDEFGQILRERLLAANIHAGEFRSHLRDSRQIRPDPFLGILLKGASIEGSPKLNDPLLNEILVAAGCRHDSRMANQRSDAYVGFRARQSDTKLRDSKGDAASIGGALKTRYDWIAKGFEGPNEQWASYRYIQPSSESVEYLVKLADVVAGIAEKVLDEAINN